MKTKFTVIYKWIVRLFAVAAFVIPIPVAISIWKAYNEVRPEGDASVIGFIALIAIMITALSFVLDGVVLFTDSFEYRYPKYYFRSMRMFITVLYLILVIIGVSLALSVTNIGAGAVLIIIARCLSIRRMYYCSKCGKKMRKGALTKSEISDINTEFYDDSYTRSYDLSETNRYHCRRCGYSTTVTRTNRKTERHSY